MDHGSEIAFTDAVVAAQEKYGVREHNVATTARRPWGMEITGELAKFIAMRDSFYLGTASADGRPYIQHRGGVPGFLKVIDPHTLAFPDQPGNKQFITAGNLSENDQAFIFLMDYEMRQRIKLWGRARFEEADTDLISRTLSEEDDPARITRAVVFSVETWDVNCQQRIPQKFSEQTVAQVVRKLTERVAALEEKLKSYEA
ncbi:MAG: pyridoxamine 5'-phosphate oxidase family protein [Pseudomonadota bacterium]